MDDEREYEHEQHVVMAAEDERYVTTALLPAVVAGLAAAIAGGVAWGVIAAATDYEIGFAAWGIGLLAGFAVLVAARGRRGPPLQVIAVLASVLGILLGKYLTIFFLYREEVEGGASPLSGDVFQAFRDNLGVVFSAFDLLWIALAVITAWGIPREQGVTSERA